MDRVRAGATIDTETVLKVAKLFSDELTTDNMSRSQPVSLCKYMDLVPFGGDDFLRFQVRNGVGYLFYLCYLLKQPQTPHITTPFCHYPTWKLNKHNTDSMNHDMNIT